MGDDRFDDPLGLTRPLVPLGPRDRVAGLLADLGLSPRAAAVGFTLCLVGGLGWWWLRSPAPPPAEAGVPMAAAVTTTSPSAAGPDGSPSSGEILVHAAGAVRRPGLYALADGDRVADLIQAAGGPIRAADLELVNLAAPVVDGTQILVPRRGEPAPPTTGVTAGSSGTPSALVDLNGAGPDELETLPGVGPATAAAIIEFREANGPFVTVEDLIDVPGIGEAKLAALVDLVTV